MENSNPQSNPLQSYNPGHDARENMDYKPLPECLKFRDWVKQKILKSVTPPFREFDNFYSLQDIVNLYHEILVDESVDYFQAPGICGPTSAPPHLTPVLITFVGIISYSIHSAFGVWAISVRRFSLGVSQTIDFGYASVPQISLQRYFGLIFRILIRALGLLSLF